jgi:alkylation response protein AidB-like acyl-CoA dehydrogenase
MSQSKSASGIPKGIPETAPKTPKDTFGNPAPWSEPAWSQGVASPYYNDSHRQLRDTVRKYIDTKIIPEHLAWEADGEAPHDVRLEWAKSGFAFSDVPQAYRPKGIPYPAGIPLDKLDVFHLLVQTDETSRVEGGVMSGLVSPGRRRTLHDDLKMSVDPCQNSVRRSC